MCTPLSAVTSLSQVPGVGATTLELLTRQQILSVQQLLGHFMLLNRDTDAMARWLHRVCFVRRRECVVIAEALFAKTERMGVL